METAIYTRAEYMAFKTSDEMTANHRRYYAEIAAACNAGALIPPDLVAHCVAALKSGNDSAFNRLPMPYRLQWWDSRVHQLRGAKKALRDRGDWLSLGTGVCILKEAARLKAEAVIAAETGEAAQ